MHSIKPSVLYCLKITDFLVRDFTCYMSLQYDFDLPNRDMLNYNNKNNKYMTSQQQKRDKYHLLSMNSL